MDPGDHVPDENREGGGHGIEAIEDTFAVEVESDPRDLPEDLGVGSEELGSGLDS